MYTWHDANYNKRLKLTIDGSKIKEDLYNFPIMIHLSNSSGITKVDTTCVFDELLESYCVLSDTFSGTSLDTSKWDTNIAPNASVTVSGALELNNFTGSAWSGAQCDSKANIPKEGKIIFRCKWKPHKNHYSSASNPAIIFYNYSTTTRNSYYGYITDNCLYLRLGADSDTTNRTQLRLYSASSQTWTTLDTVNIDIDETEWHDIYWEIDCDTKEVLVKLDDIYELTGTVNDTDWQALGSYMKLELSTADYNKNNTERFKDVYVEIPKDNSKKIALYTAVSGSDTQCYVEVDYWSTSFGFEDAVLWAKIPTISSGTDLDLYLYYDKNASNNSYIGYVGEYAAQQVWDSNFKAVYHLSQSPTGGNGCIKDSTGNDNDGTPQGSMTSDDLVDGKVGKALDFDGSDDYVNVGNSPEMSTWTLEAVVKPDRVDVTSDTNALTIVSNDQSGWNNDVLFGITPEGLSLNTNRRFALNHQDATNSVRTIVTDTSDAVTGIFYYVAGSADSSNLRLYVDGVLKDTESKNGAGLTWNGSTTYIAANPNILRPWDGIIDEIRISNTARSGAWIKATYYSFFDNLITYSTEEIKPSFIFSGYVKINNAPVARTVYLYRRLTGEFVGSTVSNSSTGYFEIPTPYDDYHFVVILPELNESYNIIAKDKIKYGD